LFKDGIEGNGDVYPLGSIWQERCNNLVVALASREHLSVLDDLQYFGRKERLWIV
jgi:hypothetical protein